MDKDNLSIRKCNQEKTHQYRLLAESFCIEFSVVPG
jgi:hypothetical protein